MDSLDILESYLESQGFKVEFCGGQCPFQIEATHRLGFSVYFHARGTCASVDTNFISSELYAWEFPAAGFLSPEEALYVFWFLWNEVRDEALA